MHQVKNSPHIPVLLDEVVQYLDPKPDESYLDLTAGYGGHAAAVLDKTKAADKAVLVDRDKEAISFLEAKFKGKGIELINQDYLTAASELLQQGKKFDLILADLGVSSAHLDNAGRGFSINLEGPLDMRMDRSQQLTADKITNTYSAEQLETVLRDYGEEPRYRQIARMIVQNRPIGTTGELAAIAAKSAGWRKASKKHPATRTFQALRIAVNDELQLLRQALKVWTDLLEPGGRLAVISFHSLEDRIVKRFLNETAGERYDADLRLLTKHPVKPSGQEVAINPRARSAKLRAAVKINS